MQPLMSGLDSGYVSPHRSIRRELSRNRQISLHSDLTFHVNQDSAMLPARHRFSIKDPAAVQSVPLPASPTILYRAFSGDHSGENHVSEQDRCSTRALNYPARC